MLDMSKAFDTIQRGTLFEDLKEILEPDELHLIHHLLNDVEILLRWLAGNFIIDSFSLKRAYLFIIMLSVCCLLISGILNKSYVCDQRYEALKFQFRPF